MYVYIIYYSDTAQLLNECRFISFLFCMVMNVDFSFCSQQLDGILGTVLERRSEAHKIGYLQAKRTSGYHTATAKPPLGSHLYAKNGFSEKAVESFKQDVLVRCKAKL